MERCRYILCSELGPEDLYDSSLERCRYPRAVLGAAPDGGLNCNPAVESLRRRNSAGTVQSAGPEDACSL